MRFVTVLIVVIFMLGCKKKEAPKPPEVVNLVHPEKGLECTTGIEISATSSQVEFRWQAANNTETYELIITDLSNGNKQDITTEITTAQIPLNKGTPYSWVVLSKNSKVLESASSQTWQFYNSGFETTHAPFPALVKEPEMGASVVKDINNEVLLKWSSGDVDNDIEEVAIYLATENPPETLIMTLEPNVDSAKVTVAADMVYYWKIVTKDSEGNTSDSGIYEFRVY